MTQETTNAADAAQTPTGYLSLPWARALLQRCAAAENRIREEFAPDDGRQPEDASDWPADECQRWLEGWALGNLSARRAALQAHRDLESERKLPISVFASEPVEVKAGRAHGARATAVRHSASAGGRRGAARAAGVGSC